MANLEVATTIAFMGTAAIFAYLYVKTETENALRLGFLFLCILFMAISIITLSIFAGLQSETIIQNLLAYPFWGILIFFIFLLALWIFQLMIDGFSILRPKKETKEDIID